MTRKADLYNEPVSLDDIRRFIGNVTEHAIADHGMKAPRKSGDELCDLYTSACRRDHKRMASSIYNKVRWTLDTSYNG